jgi:tetratricopeptide (TPR) repeat protein
MSSQSPDSLIQELISKCESAVSSGNYEEAITGCRAVLQAAPDNLKAKQLLDEAQSKMEADLFVKDNLRKAQDYFNSRDFQKCISECQKIQLLDPNNATVLKLMQMAQEKMEAEPFVQNFITSGQSLYDSGLFTEAISQWEKVRAIDPVYPGLDGLIKDAREKMGGAREEEPTLVGFNSDDGTEDTVMTDGMPSFELNLDNILSESSGQPFSFDSVSVDSEDQQQATEKLEFLSDEDRIKQLLRDGDQLSSHGHFQRAIEVWSEIFMLDVNHPEALQKIEVARQAAAQQRAASQEIVKRAIASYEGGNIEEARELFEQVRATDPDNPEAARYMEMLPAAGEGPATLEDLIAQGEDAEKRGQYREAAMMFSQALAIDADNAELADRVKNLNLMAKRQEQGRTVIGNARAFLAEGKLESARHAVTKILEADPSNAEALEIMKEIKAQMGSASASSEAGAVTAGVAVRTAAARKSLPLSKILMGVGAVVVLGLGFFMYKTFTAKPKNQSARVIVTKKPIKKSAAATTKTPVKPVVILSPQDKERSDKLVQEAQFYFMEKRYAEAQQKAEEALKIDPSNTDAASVKSEADRIQKEAIAAEQKVLEDANNYFAYSEFAGAVKLYEKYLTKHPESVNTVQPQIIKCYYNLGVIAIRTWRCDTAADYFRQVLFIDDTDNLSKEALGLARKCQQLGTADVEVRKAVAFMEMRK